MAEVGIDLGTTTSGVAILRNKPQMIEIMGRQMTPSVVAWDTGSFIVGQSAKDQAADLSSIVSVKRSMGTDKTFKLGDRTMTAPEVSAEILKVLKKGAEDTLGEPVESAVITIPAYFNTAQTEATKKAGELAGFKSTRLLAEPIAAALAYGAEETVLVYDLGGGTFDVAVIDCFDYTMLGLDGDPWLGGDDFDNRLIQYLATEVKSAFGVDLEADPQARQLAKNQCEQAKIDLSTREETRIRFQTGINNKFVNLMLKVTRAQFEAMIMDIVDRSIQKVDSAIATAKKKDGSFSKDSIETILLVGGSTYVPLVQRKVAEYFGRPPSKRVNPDLAVTLGAAVHTGSTPMSKAIFRIKLDPVPEVTAKLSLTVKGRTAPNAKIDIRGGSTSANGVADGEGRFSFPIDLQPDQTNELSVVATNDKGEERKGGFHIRHASDFKGEEVKPASTIGVGGGVVARTLGINVTGDDQRLGVIILRQSLIPCSEETKNYGVTSRVPGAPGSVAIEVYEGDIPYAPLNTHLWTGLLTTPPGGAAQEPLEITFTMTEERLLQVTARMVNFPDRHVDAKIQTQSPTGHKLNVLERTEKILNHLGEKLRPEDKARLNRSRQALIDLSDQYNRDGSRDCYEQIKTTGLQLRGELDRIETVPA